MNFQTTLDVFRSDGIKSLELIILRRRERLRENTLARYRSFRLASPCLFLIFFRPSNRVHLPYGYGLNTLVNQRFPPKLPRTAYRFSLEIKPRCRCRNTGTPGRSHFWFGNRVRKTFLVSPSSSCSVCSFSSFSCSLPTFPPPPSSPSPPL